MVEHAIDIHDDVIKWKHFTRYWPFVRGIPRLPVNSPHKGQWRGSLMFSLICARINGWINSGAAGDLRRHCAHFDVIVMPIHLPDPRFNIKIPFNQYGDSHYKDKMVVRTCYLYNGKSYTGKTWRLSKQAAEGWAMTCLMWILRKSDHEMLI